MVLELPLKLFGNRNGFWAFGHYLNYLKLLWIFKTYIESIKYNKLQGKLIFMQKRILDHNMVGNTKIYFK